MNGFSKDTKVGVVGSGAMGSGIAQLASQNGHSVVLYDVKKEALEEARKKLQKILDRQVEKGRMSEDEAKGVIDRIQLTRDLQAFQGCGLVVEAVVEDLKVKQSLFRELEQVVGEEPVLATNTSSLSIAAISSDCENPERILGTHFFNPAPIMPLVEIIPAITSDREKVEATKTLMDEWGKVTVLAKDTPGFIVNRLARPFYGEALRVYEEGMADAATIDHVMTQRGGFRMGPFTLMDFIGNDVNYKVTETVFTEFFYDPRYRPSFTQKRMVEAGLLGKKTGKGFYDYGPEAQNPAPDTDEELGQQVLDRIVVMLINEAVDASFLNIATNKDLDLAMTKGVNYPKGLLAWGNEKGLDKVLTSLEALQEEYGEDRYRPSPLLKRMVKRGEVFEGLD